MKIKAKGAIWDFESRSNIVRLPREPWEKITSILKTDSISGYEWNVFYKSRAGEIEETWPEMQPSQQATQSRDPLAFNEWNRHQNQELSF